MTDREKYISSIDARFKDDDRIYYFGWVYGNGHCEFGFHGTEAEYVENEKKMLISLPK